MKDAREFYSGSWNTNSQIRKVKLSCEPLNTARLFKISKFPISQGALISHKIEVDGVLIDHPFHDGGSVIIKGEEIVLHHISGDANFKGTWEILDSPIANEEERTIISTWAIDSEFPDQIVVADFGEPREFIIQSENMETQPVGDFRLIIDGKDFQWGSSGEPVLYPLGSSVICYGSVVRVHMNATGSPPVKLTGTIKILI